jgi:hypothetical protein
MYKEAIYKIATLDAIRKKQYWQLLKRLHGGTDKTVDTLKKTRDFGIYHGTNPKNVDSIMSQGLKKPTGELGQHYGKGVYFGPGDKAKSYGEGTLRLKKPSELKGTKELYPKTSKAMVNNMKINPKKADKNLVNAQTYGKDLQGQNTRELGDKAMKDTQFKRNFVNKSHVYAKTPSMFGSSFKPYMNNRPPLSSQFVYKSNIKPNLITKAE